MKRYLLDTNICIFLLNQSHGFENIVDRIDHLDREQVIISSITVAELEFGVAASQKIEQNSIKLDLFLSAFKRLPFDDSAAHVYGSVRTSLKQRGLPIGPLDTLIAAHALALDACAVTNNIGEFSRVEGLRVEDWTLPKK